MTAHTLDEVNSMPASAFVQLLGGIFEHSPWVAERAQGERPFADIEALHAAMVHAVDIATPAEQLALLRVHPELAGREARAGELTESSQAEQSSAKLNALTPHELARMSELNAAYRRKFGFPFIIAVRNYTKDQIFSELERRIANNANAELRAALAQVYAITRMRLDALLKATGT